MRSLLLTLTLIACGFCTQTFPELHLTNQLCRSIFPSTIFDGRLRASRRGERSCARSSGRRSRLHLAGRASNEAGSSSEEGAIPVHPQLGTLADGRGALAAPRRGQVQGAQRGDGGHAGKTGGRRGYGRDRGGRLGPEVEDARALPERALRPSHSVCDEANEACPFFPGAKNRLHWSFEDPFRTIGSDEERLEAFRVMRDGSR